MKNIVSYGGGTQSTAMILMALEGEFNLPRPDFGVYSDTGGEPEFINEYVRYFIDYVKHKYDFDIFITQNKQGLVHELTIEPPKMTDKDGIIKYYTSSVPPYFTLDESGKVGMLMRQCTTDYKLNHITKLINSKLEQGEKYRMWIGISFDERSRMRISTNKRRENYYPLVDNFLRRIDGINFVNEMGLKPPQRSSCYFCPFHSNRYWQWLKDNHSTEFQRAVDFEKKVQVRQNDFKTDQIFLHRSCKPLNDVQFSDPDQLNMFPELIDECGGEWNLKPKEMTDLQKAKMIIEIVCDEFQQRQKDVKGKRNYRAFVTPRQFSMYYIRKYTRLSQEDTGRLFGKDHSTICYAESAIPTLIKYNGFKAVDIRLKAKIIKAIFTSVVFKQLREKRHRYHFRTVFKRSRIKTDSKLVETLDK